MRGSEARWSDRVYHSEHSRKDSESGAKWLNSSEFCALAGLEQRVPGRWVRVMHSDDRVSGPTDLDIELGEEMAGRSLRWTVCYQRVLFPGVGSPSGIEIPKADGEIVLASGHLPVQ